MGDVGRIVIPLAILGFGVAVLTAVVLWGQPITGSVEPEPPGAPLVQTEAVEPQTGALDIDVDGHVVPHREITLAAEVAGRVVKKSDACQAGYYVAKGAVLLEIDPSDYRLEVRRLEKELDQSKADLDELRVEEENIQPLTKLAHESLRLQQREVARLEKLTKKDYVTDSQMDLERRNELTARNALVTLENQTRSIQQKRVRLESARDLTEVRLEKAKLDLERTKILAPIDGMVIQDAVEADAFVSRGMPLVTMEDVSAVEVRCNLRMDDAYWVWSQARSEASAPADPRQRNYQPPATDATVLYALGGRDYCWHGVLLRYEGIGLDEATRTVPCTVMVADPRNVRSTGPGEARPDEAPPALVRGMYVRVILHTRPQVALLRVPEIAIRPGDKVWRVREGKLKAVDVRVVNILDKTAIIQTAPGELTAGDRVVVSPMSAAADGMTVREQRETKQ